MMDNINTTNIHTHLLSGDMTCFLRTILFLYQTSDVSWPWTCESKNYFDEFRTWNTKIAARKGEQVSFTIKKSGDLFFPRSKLTCQCRLIIYRRVSTKHDTFRTAVVFMNMPGSTEYICWLCTCFSGGFHFRAHIGNQTRWQRCGPVWYNRRDIRCTEAVIYQGKGGKLHKIN